MLVSCLTGGESRGDCCPRDLLVTLNPQADTDSNTVISRMYSELPGVISARFCARQAVLMRPPDPSRLENATNYCNGFVDCLTQRPHPVVFDGWQVLAASDLPGPGDSGQLGHAWHLICRAGLISVLRLESKQSIARQIK